ncbi:MAG: hypothetical protein ACJASN_001713 [Cyclobacteriaceae bacterium]|jgi:hypothetical protein
MRHIEKFLAPESLSKPPNKIKKLGTPYSVPLRKNNSAEYEIFEYRHGTCHTSSNSNRRNEGVTSSRISNSRAHRQPRISRSLFWTGHTKLQT